MCNYEYIYFTTNEILVDLMITFKRPFSLARSKRLLFHTLIFLPYFFGGGVVGYREENSCRKPACLKQGHKPSPVPTRGMDPGYNGEKLGR